MVHFAKMALFPHSIIIGEFRRKRHNTVAPRVDGIHYLLLPVISKEFFRKMHNTKHTLNLPAINSPRSPPVPREVGSKNAARRLRCIWRAVTRFQTISGKFGVQKHHERVTQRIASIGSFPPTKMPREFSRKVLNESTRLHLESIASFLFSFCKFEGAIS